MKYLLAFLFHARSPGVDKIVQFKRRYDPKLGLFPGLHTGLLPPFILSPGERERDLIHGLEEDIESFFKGHHHLAIEVERMEVQNRKGMHHQLALRLRPPEEVVHLQEMLAQQFPVEIASWPKGAINLEMMITLGKFSGQAQLHESIQQSGLEFDFPFLLKVDQIALLKRIPREWQMASSLARFESDLGLATKQ